jgi:hypothetical protein
MGVAMTDLSRGERLQIMLTEEELNALDDWRFERRMPSRAAAVRELLKRGLAAEGIAVAAGRTKSQDYGVVSDGARLPKKNGDGSGVEG